MPTFITPVDVSTATTGSYVDVDVSAYVSSNATAAIIYITTSNNALSYYVRKNGSTDDLASGSSQYHQWAIVGLDSSKIFEQKISGVAVDMFLVGYFESECTMFTNATDKSTGTTGSYVDVDISSNTGADTAIVATGLIFQGNTNTNKRGAVRKNGSTDDFYGTSTTTTFTARSAFFTVAVDASEIFEQKIGSTSVDLYLTGYLTAGGTFNTNGTDRSLGSTGSWIDLTALPSGAIGGLYLAHNTGTTTTRNYGFRVNGSSSEDYNGILPKDNGNYAALTAIVQCDGSRIVEGKIDNVVVDFYEMGYFTTISSGRRIFII
jgi:hypothetical protein